MSLSTLSPQAAASSKLVESTLGAHEEEADCLAQIDEARRSFEAFRANPGDRSLKDQLAVALRGASAAVSFLPRKDQEDPAVFAALELVRLISESGGISRLFDGAVVESVVSLRAQKYWPGLVARMLLQPAWQAPVAPAFAEVPDWLWSDYAAWVFAAPQYFVQPADADDYARHTGQKMDELVQWVRKNIGSPAVRAALDAYLTNFSFLPLTVSGSDLKRHAELHARLLTAGTRVDSVNAITGGRVGRPLRVAFVGSTPAVIPEFSRLLDAQRFEISLYVLDGAAEANGEDSNAASFAILSLLKSGNRTRQFQALAPSLAEQLSELQSANLDIVIFTEELTASDGRLHRLALHRLAPLHVFSAASVSSGLPTADLFVATEAENVFDAEGQFSERLAIREGCHLTFSDLPAPAANREAARAALGFSDQSFVIMIAARAIEISPALRQSCVELLRDLPNASVALQLLHSDVMPSGSIEAFAAEWDEALGSAEVDSSRLLVLGGAIESLAHLQSVVAAADVFLDVSAFAEPDLLNVPIALHVPTITLEGDAFRARRGAGLLRSLGLESLVVRNQAGLCEVVSRLARHQDQRDQVVTQLQQTMERLPLCRDQLAAAESMGFILENAYDELHAKGPREFRKGKRIQRTSSEISVEENLQRGTAALLAREFSKALREARDVLRVAPAHSTARWIFGVASLELGQVTRAVDYLLAAVQNSDNAATWYDLAVALRQNNQNQQAVQALETSLRLDATRTDAWAMLIELADAVGAHELATEARSTFAQLDPTESRSDHFTGRESQR